MSLAMWVSLIVAGAIVTLLLALFLSFRADYAAYPERTLIAAKLTLSTVKHFARIKRGEPTVPDRRAASHPRRAAEDMGTINRPIPRITDPRKRHLEEPPND